MPGASDRTAWFLSAILIAVIENCSSSDGDIMGLNVDSMWLASTLHDSCDVEMILHM